MKAGVLSARAILVMAVFGALATIGVTRGLFPSQTPPLTTCNFSNSEMAQLTLDIFTKALETQSEYLFACSADSSTRYCIDSSSSTLRMKRDDLASDTRKSESSLAVVCQTLIWDSVSADTVVAACNFIMVRDDSCVFRAPSQVSLTKIESEWRVSYVEILDSLVVTAFSIGAWQ